MDSKKSSKELKSDIVSKSQSKDKQKVKNQTKQVINSKSESKDERKKFSSFLDTKKTQSEYYTFGSINPPGKYTVENNDIEKYWDLYCDAIYFDPMSSFTITEKPEPYIPVLADIDVKINIDSPEFKLINPDFKAP